MQFASAVCLYRFSNDRNSSELTLELSQAGRGGRSLKCLRWDASHGDVISCPTRVWGTPLLCAPAGRGPVPAVAPQFLFIPRLNITSRPEDWSRISRVPGVRRNREADHSLALRHETTSQGRHLSMYRSGAREEVPICGLNPRLLTQTQATPQPSPQAHLRGTGREPPVPSHSPLH